MLSQYPIFTKLEITHKDFIQNICSKFEPYSDFNFVSLYCWNTDGSAEVCLLGNSLVIRLPDYMTGDKVTALLGDNKVDDALNTLLKDCKELKLVPSRTATSLEAPENFHLELDRDQFDYIYSVADLAALTGGKYKKKRNKLKKVTEDLKGRLSSKFIRNLEAEISAGLLRVFENWASYSSQSDDDLAAEFIAFKRMLQNFNEFQLLGTLIYLDEELVGFSINELSPNGKNATCHFEKALPVHEQIYTFLANQSSNDLLQLGCEYVNWEQDLGIAGLRQAKMSYSPAKFLEKYAVTKA